MSSQLFKTPLIDLFPPDDGRLRVLAIGAGSYSSQTGSWAWLLRAKGQDKALLYTGKTQISALSCLPYAAIAALGSYLGFPAQALVLLQGLPNEALAPAEIPEPYRKDIQKYFDLGGNDPAKSHLVIGPDILSAWPVYTLLRSLAGAARLDSSASAYEILELCPNCGEYKLAGTCGCDNSHLICPTFTTLARNKNPRNRITAYGLQDWIGKYTIDYSRYPEKCPNCNGPLIPLAEAASAWKCSACGLERGASLGNGLVPPKVVSLPEAARPALPAAVEPAAPARTKKEIASLPLSLLNTVSGLYPNIWKKVDAIREERQDNKGKLPWDAAIFLPSGDWKHLLSHYQQNYGAPANARAFYRLMATGSWRPTQDIFSFDPALYEALITTPLEGKLPYAQLSRFPAWCIYFDAPGLIIEDNAYDGFFAMLDEAFGSQHLCLYFLSEAREYFVQPIRLGDWDLQEGFLSNIRESKLADQQRLAQLAKKRLRFDQGITAAINLILFALTQTSIAKKQTAAAIHRPEAKKTRNGWRLFAPARPNFHLLGEDIGQQLREAVATPRISSGQRSSPCPHIRRGHWHHFWKGPKKSILDLRWLPPIPVALAQAEMV